MQSSFREESLLPFQTRVLPWKKLKGFGASESLTVGAEPGHGSRNRPQLQPPECSVSQLFSLFVLPPVYRGAC